MVSNKRSRPSLELEPLSDSEDDTWEWDGKRKSCDARLLDSNPRMILFHPTWSTGTSAVMGTKRLNGTLSFWEIRLSSRVFGTSIMVGFGTTSARLGCMGYKNLLGEDASSWGVSHKGLIWHDNSATPYCQPLQENTPVTLGVLFDGFAGVASFYKDGQNLGVAFTNLHEVPEDVFPMVSSTSARTRMELSAMKRSFGTLKDRCRGVILNYLQHDTSSLKEPILPSHLISYLRQYEKSHPRSTWWHSNY